MSAGLDQGCCSSPRAIKFVDHRLRVVIGGREHLARASAACLSCGAVSLHGAAGGAVLAHAEVPALQQRWDARIYAQECVTKGEAIGDDSGLPDPFWLYGMGHMPTVHPEAMFGGYDCLAPDQLEQRIREIINAPAPGDVVPVAAPIEGVAFDDVFVRHFFDLDAATGKDNLNEDHLFFLPLIHTTLQSPLEVWLQQEGGIKTRKTMFLAAYMLDAAPTYHLVVLMRNSRVLTAYRLNGGVASFRKHRRGVPLHMAY